MAADSPSNTPAASVAVVLLQPIKLGGKRREAGDTFEATATVAEDLVASGSAALAADTASGKAGDLPNAKPGTKSRASRAAAPSAD